MTTKPGQFWSCCLQQQTAYFQVISESELKADINCSYFPKPEFKVKDCIQQWLQIQEI